MKKILCLILVFGAFFALSSYADTVKNIQEKAIEQLLSVRNIRVSEELDICSSDICLCESFTEEGLSFQLLTGEKRELQDCFVNDISAQFSAKTSSIKSQKIETYAVVINIIDGYTFHIADYYGYYGHSRVVTCLDGAMRGRQGISDNGILMVESTDVKWHKDYFEHTYPAGKVYTYTNKQVMEFK